MQVDEKPVKVITLKR